MLTPIANVLVAFAAGNIEAEAGACDTGEV